MYDTCLWNNIHKRSRRIKFCKPYQHYFFVGNDNIHEITSHGNHDLRIELTDFDGNMRYAEYSIFTVADEENGYRLLVYNYSGNAGKC